MKSLKLFFLVTVTAALLTISLSASAVVKYETIVNPTELGGRISGPVGDIFFEGGANDSNLTDFPCCPPGTPGLNTIGSTGYSTFYDNFTNFNILSQVYTQSTWEVGAGQSVFGNNQFTSFMGQAEFAGVADGLQPGIETISNVDQSIITVNPNNTSTFITFTEDENFIYTDTSIASYYLLRGQDPSSVFSDTSLFDVNDFAGEVTQSGIIDHFNYLINDIVDPNWTFLGWSYWTIEGAAKSGSGFDDVLGLGVASFVSYDLGAIPVPVPAAVWLFGSALLGFVGISRRRKS